jgi:hypothetical protein
VISSRAGAPAVALGLLLYAGLALGAVRTKSATFDEGAHLPAGYTALAFGDHRLNPEQPPLVKLLAASALLPLKPTFKVDDLAWAEARQWELGRRFLYRWNDGDRLLFRGRVAVSGLGVLLALSVFLWTKRLFGRAPAFLALFLCVLSPDLLGHGPLVATDVALALFLFIAVALFDLATEKATPIRVLSTGVAAGAALASKFSAPVVFLILGALAAALALRSEPVRDFRDRLVEGLGARALHLLLVLAIVAVAALVVLWASYGFDGRVSRDPVLEASLRAAVGPPSTATERVAVALGGLVPEDYVRGLLFVLENAKGRSTFLRGELSAAGFPSYFLWTFLLKTPLPLFGFLALSIALAPRLGARTTLFLAVPLAVYGALALTSRLQIGHRHLLPLYPFLFVVAGRAVSVLARRPAQARAGALALGALCAWYALGTLRLHPDYLAYFNELAGGPGSGWRSLVDSNLDWGQDLPGLKRWMDAHGVDRIKLSYFGSADPAYYGIDAELLPSTMSPHPTRVVREVRPGDLVAISATNLQGVYLDPEDRPLMDRFRALRPVASIGYSILVFRADFTWPAS